MNATWWQILVATISGGVLVGCLTQAVPSFIHYLRRPRIDLYLDANKKKTYYTRPLAGTTHSGRWIAIWARNTPRWGSRTAKDCRPELIRFERQGQDEIYEEEIAFVRDRLSWGGMGGEKGRGFADRDIDKGDPLRIALVSVAQGTPKFLLVQTQSTVVPAGRKLQFEPGTYRATVRLYSANAHWGEKQFLIHHTGEWDQLSISEEQQVRVSAAPTNRGK